MSVKTENIKAWTARQRQRCWNLENITINNYILTEINY